MNKKLNQLIKPSSKDPDFESETIYNDLKLRTTSPSEPLSTKEKVATAAGILLFIASFTVLIIPEEYLLWIGDPLWLFFIGLYGGIFLYFYGQARTLTNTLDVFLKPKVASSLAGHLDPSIGRKEFEEFRVKLKTDLIITRSSVTFSNLSTNAKEHCLLLLQEADRSLATAQTSGELEHIARLINTASGIKDIIKKESISVVGYTVIALSLLGFLAFLTQSNWDQVAFKETVFGLPRAVLLWSGIGGFVSVLFRYVFQQEEFQEPTPKWLFIRPVMGIVLGAVTYFAVSIGLFLIDPSMTTDTLVKDRGLLFIVLAFVSGFSDKFAIFILSSVMGRVAPGWSAQEAGTLNEPRADKRKPKKEESKMNKPPSPNGRHPNGKKVEA